MSSRYPLTVRLAGGRVRHAAREVACGVVMTLCGKRGRTAPGSYGPRCTACASRPNPIDCRSYAQPDDSEAAA